MLHPVGQISSGKEQYFHLGNLCSGLHDKVFRAIVHAKTGETLHKTAGGLSYTKLRLRAIAC